MLPALKTFEFGRYLNRLVNFNWAEFVSVLDKLGYCDTKFVRQILNKNYLQSVKWHNKESVEKLKEILNRYDAAASNASEYSDNESSVSADETRTTTTTTMATAEDNDQSLMHKDLTKMFGADKICLNVQIDENVIVPLALKIDLKSGEFLPIASVPHPLRCINNDELL